MKLLDRKGYDTTLIEDPAPYTVEISKYQKYGELLKNSIESYLLRDKVVLVMKDMVGVEQALAMGAENDIHLMTAQKYNVKSLIL